MSVPSIELKIYHKISIGEHVIMSLHCMILGSHYMMWLVCLLIVVSDSTFQQFLCI